MALSLKWLALLHYFDRSLFEELLQNKLALWPIVRFSYFYTATLSLSLSISSPTITHTQTRILKFQQWPADSEVSIVKSFYMCVSVRVVCVLFLLFNVLAFQVGVFLREYQKEPTFTEREKRRPHVSGIIVLK